MAENEHRGRAGPNPGVGHDIGERRHEDIEGQIEARSGHGAGSPSRMSSRPCMRIISRRPPSQRRRWLCERARDRRPSRPGPAPPTRSGRGCLPRRGGIPYSTSSTMENALCGTRLSAPSVKHIPFPRKPQDRPNRSRPAERTSWKRANASAMRRVRQEAVLLSTAYSAWTASAPSSRWAAKAASRLVQSTAGACQAAKGRDSPGLHQRGLR